MVQQGLGLHLISKLRHDAALSIEYEGEQKKSGPRRRCGDRLDYQAIPERYRMQTTQDKHLRSDVYQARMLHECFADPINVFSLFMVNVPHRLLADVHATRPDAGVLDLKAFCLGRKDVQATIQLLPESPDTNMIAAIVRQVASLDVIHPLNLLPLNHRLWRRYWLLTTISRNHPRSTVLASKYVPM